MESGAAAGIGVPDQLYEAAGASVVHSADEIYRRAELVVKVKEPQPAECRLLRDGQVVFAYLHLAADSAQAQALVDSGVVAIAYETVTAPDGSLPLLTPMSEVAGRMSVQIAAGCMQKANGGSGVLLGGVPGVTPAQVVVLGGGVAGTQAVEIAAGMQAEVTVVDRSVQRLRELAARFRGRVKTVFSTSQEIEELVTRADVVIGAVLIAGASTPKLVRREIVAQMKPLSVIVDISIDQGGCVATSHPTTHADPTYVQQGVIHYCVTNMPGAVPRTSTYALTYATLPYVRALANYGWRDALARDPRLASGLNVSGGKIVHEAVASALRGLPRQ